MSSAKNTHDDDYNEDNYYKDYPIPSPIPIFTQVKESIMNSKYKDLLWPKDYMTSKSSESMARDIYKKNA